MKQNDIDNLIIDALVERTQTFFIEGRQFVLYPMTMGKMYLIAHEVRALGLNAQFIERNPTMEFLRVASTKKEKVALVVAYCFCKDKEEVMNATYIQNLVDFFVCIDTEDLATMLMVVLNNEHSARFMEHYEIDKDFKLLRKVQQLKKKHDFSINIGGRTPWGTIIDWACERYGWSVDYVVWGVSYTALQMMMADNVKNIYLTEEENKKLHIPKPGDEIVKVDEMTMEEFEKLGIKFD